MILLLIFIKSKSSFILSGVSIFSFFPLFSLFLNLPSGGAEQLLFAFAAQLNEGKWHLFDTAIIALTSERIIIGHKGLIYGYNFITVTPDMYNDLTIKAGLIWGTIIIDTVKEQITISNIDKNALPEIETYITTFME